MNATKRKLPELVLEELEAANREHGPFSSAHEGWAVMQEEYEETREAYLGLSLEMFRLWEAVKHDDSACYYGYAMQVRECALQIAAEALQVAAMAEKFVMIKGGGR